MSRVGSGAMSLDRKAFNRKKQGTLHGVWPKIRKIVVGRRYITRARVDVELALGKRAWDDMLLTLEFFYV